MNKKHLEGGGYQTLKVQTTIDDVLKTTMSFEKTAYEFYGGLQEQVSNRLRPLVQELIDEEKQHYALFKQLTQYADVRVHIQDTVKTPTSDYKFSDYIRAPKLDALPDDESILQYEMGREQAAMEQYSALAEETPVGPIQDLFRFLANEELEHKQELEKRYYNLTHSSST
ncbi:ferritin family protein [Candidatus Albibeggiatoa sp. nov. NOAA]|uniref:ferritin family protein n=1 Tax=Candidatus Albibeggiatoa sp. nov. NOAA TaxID=3162724 RepID=UPI0032F57859|nr:ferritin family protein [Thiotrichaceae bacterium]